MIVGMSLPSRGRGLKLMFGRILTMRCSVAPLAGAWIEIVPPAFPLPVLYLVAPLAGAWIEILTFYPILCENGSLPSRGRGLKLLIEKPTRPLIIVAPLAGAWIEIYASCSPYTTHNVAPLAGAWIEIASIC